MPLIKHCILITPVVMYNVYYFCDNFKENLRALSGWFLTKHPINKNMISLKPEIGVLICGCLLYILSPLTSRLHLASTSTHAAVNSTFTNWSKWGKSTKLNFTPFGHKLKPLQVYRKLLVVSQFDEIFRVQCFILFISWKSRTREVRFSWN